MRIFLSYSANDDTFISQIYWHLVRHPELEVYYYSEKPVEGRWQPKVFQAMDRCDHFIFFCSEELRNGQEEELNHWLDDANRGYRDNFLRCNLGQKQQPFPTEIYNKMEEIGLDSRSLHELTPIDHLDDGMALQCAQEITRRLKIQWLPFDGLPRGYVFHYEKDIIRAYRNRDSKNYLKYVKKGCPADWPQAGKVSSGNSSIQNPIPESEGGAYRTEQDVILVDAKQAYYAGDQPSCRETGNGQLASVESVALQNRRLTFLEAGPREHLAYSLENDDLSVGIIVSGGIAPGINAVVAGIVERLERYESGFHVNPEDKTRHINIYKYQDGLKLLTRNDINARSLLDSENLIKQATTGGSLISTARCDDLLATADVTDRCNYLNTLVDQFQNLDMLFLIGGDGTMKAAHAIDTVFRQKHPSKRMSVVGIPKTMDNDILWVWQSFGFMSAVERACQITRQLHTEARSNPRFCVIQLFGSDSGFVVSHAALGSGVCDFAFIPEAEYTMDEIWFDVWNKLQSRLSLRKGMSPYGILVMAETAIPRDVKQYMNADYIGLVEEEKEAIELYIKNGRRVFGQTSDHLRKAGLKIIVKELQERIRRQPGPYWGDFRVFSNEPRHLIRSMEPSVTDVIYGHRLGTLAVDNAMGGYTDFMISQWLTEFVLVPLELVVLGRKRVYQKGIFWKSVVSNTGQPAGTLDDDNESESRDLGE